ncbi:MAG TPA: hypothetical protein VGB63_08210 [Pedobacter sp.]|jgi:hypothetical protein
MNSIVCTLFEGNYHFGLAGLVNSLECNEFEGDIYAGYKGQLPPWAHEAKSGIIVLSGWKESFTLKVSEKINLHFLPIDTKFHLTNYKPYFMVELFNDVQINADAVTYFDPDIIVKCKWKFFENWMSHGVSLVHEIISNDMPSTHPIRLEWENVVRKSNKRVTRHLTSYINGGFCGVLRNNIEFLNTWCDITDTAIKYFKLTPDQWNHSYDRTYIFYAQDQDALNITAMCSESPISEMGPEAMDFINGGFTMSHAVGSPKPWRKNYMLSALNGNPPTLTDKAYWSSTNSSLKTHDSLTLSRKHWAIKFASLLGRFYRR